MNKIQVLDIATVNKIAAGEVVERPASAVKEMAENAIDAGATKITVEIKNGGISFIRVTDNGCGIRAEEVKTAFLPHATSKIREISDLENLYTMGFRGEALASIAAVSKVELITKRKEDTLGTALSLEAGQVISENEAGCPDGTTIVVKDLFFNTPARMHFMKKDSAEAAHVTEVVQRLALGYPNISFRLINNGRETLLTPGTGDLKDVLPVIYGSEMASKMIKVECERDGVKVKGYIGKPEISRNNRTMQNFFVNGRWVKSKEIQYSAEAGYKTMLMTGKHPVLVLAVEVSPMLTDVNVHPQKMEIKFANEKPVTSTVFWGVQNALFEQPVAREVESKKAEIKSTYKAKPFNVIEPKELPRKEEETFDFFSKESEALFTPSEESIETSFFDDNFNEAEIPYTASEQITEKVSAYTSDEYKVKGQIFDTYILIEQENELLLMDQHAAHERLRYEEMIKDRQIFGQILLMPEIINLSVTDGELLLSHKEDFDKLGFDIEPFGNGQYAVRRMPDDISSDTAENTVISILELIKQKKNPEDVMDEAFFMIACKGAVKANHKMTQAELEGLVNQVFQNEKIRTCPHGRPLIISFSKKYIEKEFKRIV